MQSKLQEVQLSDFSPLKKLPPNKKSADERMKLRSPRRAEDLCTTVNIRKSYILSIY